MLAAFKQGLRQSFLRSIYLWTANRYRSTRRLFTYPDTAQVGAVDYDLYWDSKAPQGLGQLSSWRLKRAQVFTSLVENGDSVLDLGVGDGALLCYMVEQKSIRAYGLDVSPKAVAFCREQGLDVALADLSEPIGDYVKEPFDYIILSEIIEHLPDPENLIDRLRPLARKAIIVSIPNTGFYQHRLRLVFGRFPLQWVVTPGEHVRFWTRIDFHWWARQMGLRILREIPYEGTPRLKDIWPGLFAAAFVYMVADNRTTQARVGEQA